MNIDTGISTTEMEEIYREARKELAERDEARRERYMNNEEDDQETVKMVEDIMMGFTTCREKGWNYISSLHDIVDSYPMMKFEDEFGTVYYRDCNEEELNKVIWDGPLFRFPVVVKYEKSEKIYKIKKGEQWTLRNILEKMKLIYTKNQIKLLGDHHFFEGFVENTFHLGS